MKNEKLQRAKGVRDFTPQEKIARNEFEKKLRSIFELYGYNPIETPVIERYDLFASKYGLGQESDAMKETFKFKDQGKRDLVLRTEFTMPLARFIAMNQDIRMPFKRYQIGKVFRDGPIKLGRYREFYQCDIDAVGITDNMIDAEIIECAQTVFNELELDVVIKLNNRKLLNAILENAKISKKDFESVIISLDKLDKLGAKGVKSELLEKKIESQKIDQVLKLISISGTNNEIIKKLGQTLGNNAGLEEIKQTLKNLSNQKNVQFNPSLARGLAYYTGNIFEVELKNKKQFSSSLAGGGRYDDMIAGLIGGNEIVPAIGISFGFDAIFDALNLKNKKNQKKTIAQVYVIAVTENERKTAFDLCAQLRKAGIKTDFDFCGRKVKRNFEYADKLEIPWVVIIGEEEVAKKIATLRNMKTGAQEVLDLEQIVNKCK